MEPITDLLELSRLLHNLVRLGTVAEIDPARPKRVRVQSGTLLTNWLRWITPRAGDTRDWDPPTRGEQVILFSPSGDIAAALVLPAVYCDEHDAPTLDRNKTLRRFPDGAEVEYDHVEHAMRITLPDGGTVAVIAPIKITLDTPLVHCTGNVRVDGDVIAGEEGVSQLHHKHDEVRRGTEVSGEPVV
ncbi:phage baseplate assembly protein V [Cupriavidus nantongensis]|uniref:Gp5/Type VI secretion system Vgr protein OB-fold domain-containing protein n=1 Tax=Cupriavidus nantongensis TaxID=1796606 RepID=A0A142JGU2_9BURK|nr:phage baseplate assembly protein V [Cupriavidus nantongensis]AMR77304.1 hypothetical protein A2G96_05910 [Cupriavidus nantongensis]